MKRSWIGLIVCFFALLCASCGKTGSSEPGGGASTTGTNSGKLDKSTAEGLLRSLPEISTGKVECTVWFLQKADKVWTFVESDATAKSCVSGLMQAGLASQGRCTSDGCTTGCCDREVVATEKSHFGVKPIGLKFACGELKFIGVTSITTDGNKATAKYEREVVLDSQLISALSTCKLDKPEEGKKERERQFSRDDAGKWSLTGK